LPDGFDFVIFVHEVNDRDKITVCRKAFVGNTTILAVDNEDEGAVLSVD